MADLTENKLRKKRIYIVTIASFAINVVLTILKFVFGFLGNSHAMVADAFHSFSDFVTDAVVLLFVRIAGKPSSSDYAYGHGKFETIATTIIGLALLCVGLAIFFDGAKLIWAYFHGDILNKPEIITLWVALLSILLKEWLYWWTIHVGKLTKSQALMANAWHHRSDSFSSIAVAVGICGAIFLGEKWRVLDPLMAVVVSIFIIAVSLKFIKNSIDELLEKSLPQKTREEIMNIINSVEGFSDPHGLKTRQIGNNIAIEIHLRFDKNMTIEKAHNTATEIEEKLKAKYGKQTHVITHLEV